MKLIKTHLVDNKGRSRLYEIEQMHREKKPIPDWGTSGAQSIMDPGDIKEFSDAHTANGASLTFSDMEAKLEAVLRERYEGKSSRLSFKPDKMTVDTCMQIALTQKEETGDGGKRQADSVRGKPQARITAAGSMFSLVCDTIAISSSMFRVVDMGTAQNVRPLAFQPGDHSIPSDEYRFNAQAASPD